MRCANGLVEIIVGDCRESLSALPDRSAQCCITSPPYFGLRDYGHASQIGMERDLGSYIDALVSVFREVKRVLADDGTLWLNLGDSYASSGKGGNPADSPHQTQSTNRGSLTARAGKKRSYGLKPKDLLGVPWRVAFALQEDGWHLRQDIIWHKPNPMPESVRDRCSKAHEYLFLLSKSSRYYYDRDAVMEKGTSRDPASKASDKHIAVAQSDPRSRTKANLHRVGPADKRNRRSVWTVASEPFTGAHFAVYPPRLIEPCILAGAPRGGLVLDPFGGAGTTGLVAARHSRRAVLCELNPDYARLAFDRISTEWREPIRVADVDHGPLFGTPQETET